MSAPTQDENAGRLDEKNISQSAAEAAQLRLFLEIHRTVVSTLEIRDLLPAISKQLRHITRHRASRILLYDPLSGQLQVRALDVPNGNGVIHEGLLVPLQSTAEGWVYTKRKPLIVDRLDATRFPSDMTRRLLDEGVRSMCVTPLTCRDRILGVLSIGSPLEAAFKEEHMSLLGEVAKPVSIAIENSLNFERISELNMRLTKEKLYLEEHISRTVPGEIIGSSSAILHVLEQVNSVAPFDSSVLITGDTGSGKELVARAIHKVSKRRDHPFIKVDCASIPAGLLESELFGHQKGAYTSAYTDHIGRLELADQGSIFLDEIGELPLELQPKLLRAIQDREFDRLGGNKTVQVNVRLIAATNRDLLQMVEEGSFRRDLYYRLNVFPILVPPLRERRGDIAMLARHFMQKFARKMNKRLDSVSPQAMQSLLNWNWPGNVRELENVIERAVILSRGSILELPALELRNEPHRDQDLYLVDNSPVPNHLATERDMILAALEGSNWVIGTPSGAAAKLGIKRTTLHAKMKKLGIHRYSHGDSVA